jgi:Flp pilus assembly protein TadD
MRYRLACALALTLALATACTYRSVMVRPAEPGAEVALAGGGGAVREGRRLLDAGRPAGAISAFRRALVREGRPLAALNGIAVVYAELGRHADSTRYFQEALRAAPTDPTTLNNIGFAALRRGELDLASHYLGEARRFGGEDPAILANLDYLTKLQDPRRPAPLKAPSVFLASLDEANRTRPRAPWPTFEIIPAAAPRLPAAPPPRPKLKPAFEAEATMPLPPRPNPFRTRLLRAVM